MTRCERWWMTFALLSLSVTHAQTAPAKSACETIRIKPGTTATLLHGNAPAGGTPLCYMLNARNGQVATLKVVDGGERVVFKIDDRAFDHADDALRVSTFKIKHHAYRVIVFAEAAEPVAEPFTLAVSLQ